MSLKKHKLIALAATSVVATTSLVSVGAIIYSNVIANNAKINALKKSMHIANEGEFRIENGKILGFKTNITKAEIEALVSEGTLKLPACDEIADNAFTFAFEKLDTAINVSIDTQTKVIGANAFMGNTKIKAIQFHKVAGTNDSALETIGANAFEQCTELTSFDIPEKVTSIGDCAFYQCEKLKTINVLGRTNLLSNVGSNAFLGIADEGEMTVADTMPIETANALASNFTTNEWGKLGFDVAKTSKPTENKWRVKKSTSYVNRIKTIPTIYLNIDESKTLKTGLKRGKVSKYEALFIPNNVTAIDNSAYRGCTSIKSLSWEKNSACASIGSYAFEGCTNLCTATNIDPTQTLTLPEATQNIGLFAFGSCSQVKELNMGKINFSNRTRSFSIGDNAFYGWKTYSATTTGGHVTFPTAVAGEMTQTQIESIFHTALKATGKLTENWFDANIVPLDNPDQYVKKTLVNLTGDDEDWTYAISGFDWSGAAAQTYNTIEIPEGYTTISENAFWDEETGKSKIPETVKTIDMSNSDIVIIGDNAFRGSSIKTVIFNDETTTIGDNAFQDCKELEGVSMPSSLTEIGANAFKGCDNAFYIDFSKLTNEQLKNIIATGGIGENAFQDFGTLVEKGGTIIWPENIDAEVKTGIIDLLKKTGLPETWIKEQTGDEAYTGGIPISYESKQILIIDENNMLTGINWDNLAIYVKAMEEKSGQKITSLPLVIPKKVKSIGYFFWNKGTGTRTDELVALIDKLSFAAGSECEHIGDSAFSECTNFKGSLTIPDSVKIINVRAFENCTGFDGTLKLPKSLNVDTVATNRGICANAFVGCSNFKTLDISLWDKDYVDTFDTTPTPPAIPVSTKAFSGWSDSTIVALASDIKTDALIAKIKYALTTVGKLPDGTLGTNVQSYSSFDAFDVSTYISTNKLQAVDNDTKKKLVLDYYIDIINNGANGKTGEEILTNDLSTSFKKAMVNSPAFNPNDNKTINVRLKNVQAHGDLIDFDVVANIDIYSNQYNYGYVVQFATSVKNLMLYSVGSQVETDVTLATSSTQGLASIKFKACADTVITTEYDKQYMYGVKNSTSFKKSAIDITNKQFSFATLYDEYNEGGIYDASNEKGVNLFNLARQEFYAAPSLFGIVLGAYDYKDIYKLVNGCDATTGLSFTPYIKVVKNESTTKYTNTPLSGSFVSSVLGNFSIYDYEVDDEGRTVYSNNAMNYKNYMPSATAEKWSTTEDFISKYGSYLVKAEDGFTAAKGEKFREEIVNSILTAMKAYFADAMADTKWIHEDDVQFYPLLDNAGNVLPIIKEVGTETKEYYANVGIKIRLWIHNGEYVENGVSKTGETVSGYKSSYEIDLPIEIRNAKLNSRYFTVDAEQTWINRGALWTIFDTSDTAQESSIKLCSTDPDHEEIGPTLRMLSWDSAANAFVVTRLIDEANEYTWSQVNGMLKRDEIKTKTEMEAWMLSHWKIISYLNFIRADVDNSNIVHISLGYNSKYLKNITW